MKRAKPRRLTSVRTDRYHELFVLDLAVDTYLLCRAGWEVPSGHYDAAGRWYPDRLLEEHGCCEAIQPHSLKRHCLSIVHIANIYRIRPAVLRRQLHVILHLDSNADWKRLSRQRIHRLNRAVHTYLLRNSQPQHPRAPSMLGASCVRRMCLNVAPVVSR